MGIVGCATVTIPTQTYRGALTPPPLAAAGQTFHDSSPRSFDKASVLIVHSGIDQVPNYQMYSFEGDMIEGLQLLRQKLAAHPRVRRLDVVNLPAWDVQSHEDLRRLGALYDAQLVLVVSTAYDFMSYYGTGGEFVGWIPYINFVIPIYRLEGSATAQVTVLDVKSGVLRLADQASASHISRSSGLYMQEHFSAISHEVHRDVFTKIAEKVGGWLEKS
jgi:hypothetical protein